MGLADELSNEINTALNQSWDVRQGRVIPTDEDISLQGGAVKLECTVLFADLVESSTLSTEFTQRVVGKTYRAFLACTARLISERGGKVAAYDGDRVMGVFIGDRKNSNAAICALNINFMITNVLRPRLKEHFSSMKEAGFEISHCVGIDTSSVLCVKAGRRNVNDIVWVGRATNLASKLSEIRNKDGYCSFISSDVFSALADDAKFGGSPEKKPMWTNFTYEFAEQKVDIYGSTWYWTP